jgi:DNA primase
MSDAIDYYVFKEWIKKHFPKIHEKNGKIRVDSIFCDAINGDKKHRLYCKPSLGMYKCMKSGEKGSLYALVVKVEQCSYEEAVEILEGDKQDLRYLESKLDQYLHPELHVAKPEFVGKKNSLNYPPNSFLITSLGETNHFRIRAEQYLAGRKLQPKGLMISVAGEYCNRIVIPYYDRNGDLVYWNARDLGNSYLRYRGPDAEVYPAAKKEEVVWMEYFPKKGSKVYLTEGEFDAMTLNACGFHAAAFGGASFNQKQFEMLKGYQMVLAFDADKAGEQGIIQLSNAMSENGFGNIMYVRPAKPYKDWNEMFIALGKDIVGHYIVKKEKQHQVLNSWNILKLKYKL